MTAAWVAGAAGVAGFAAWAARGRSSAVFGPSIYHGPRQRRAIALTFDDGPSPSTPELLRALEQFGAHATFFQCGMHVRRLPHISRQVLAAGHEVGNHTDTHQGLWLRSATTIYGELARAQQVIESATGTLPRLFRAPYGVRWPGLREAQTHLDLQGVMWTAIGRDWTLSPGQIAERLLGSVENGAIFCLHDGREQRTEPDISSTIEAVCRILPVLRAKGYQLCTVSDLLRVE